MTAALRHADGLIDCCTTGTEAGTSTYSCTRVLAYRSFRLSVVAITLLEALCSARG